MSDIKELKSKLFLERKNGRLTADDSVLEKADSYCEGYKAFLDAAKTEREAVSEAVKMAERKGFAPFEQGKKYEKGAKVYFNNRGKTIALAVIGEEAVEKGVSITAAHVDSPRLDLKPNPLYEDSDLALFKTHYYGGIKKYQWTVTPLAIHGVFALRNGEVIGVSIGEKDDEPKFVIGDLLPHLATEQSKHTLMFWWEAIPLKVTREVSL